MGKRYKPPVTLSTGEARTEVAPRDGLPEFRRFIDIGKEKGDGRKSLTRLFLAPPTPEDVADTTSLKKQWGQSLHVIGARMPFSHPGFKFRATLYEHCREKNFGEELARDIARLAIAYFQGAEVTGDTVGDKTRGVRTLVDFMATQFSDPASVSLSDLDKQFWVAFRDKQEECNSRSATKEFWSAAGIFKSHPITAHDGWLSKLKLGSQADQPAQLFDANYSDAVMYQILALCLEGFERRIGYLKRYETLTDSDMPADWLYPGREKNKQFDEEYALISDWLSDSERGYEILIDHFILHHKAGLIVRKRKYGSLEGGIATMMRRWNRRSTFHDKAQAFFRTTAQWHGFTYETGCSANLLSFYVKKKTPIENNHIIDQIGWCLANLIMIQTGVNKEVVLSMPSLQEDGRSILTRENTLFEAKDGDPAEIEVYGWKERTGTKRRTIYPLPIVKDSTLHRMLLDYERYVKVSQEGPFFEFSKKFKVRWGVAGTERFERLYPIHDNDGKLLTSVHTPKFRKVFASASLLDAIKGAQNANDLAEKVREALRHGNLDTTLSNYILRTGAGRDVMDVAIATITSEKLAESLRFKGQIDLAHKQTGKKVWLCECEDPTNPSHGVAIAEECRHYDLCLGCERSVVTSFHLPYICARIVQYEEERRNDPRIWPATFEDRWMIAQDALEQYMAKDTKNGQQLVEKARQMARSGAISLPPIIKSNRV